MHSFTLLLRFSELMSVNIYLLKGTRKPRWGQERFKPVWWPESVPWSDPNNKKSRLTKPEIGLCISSWREHRMQITSQLNPIPISQEERLHSSNDRIDDLSPNSILPLLCAYDQLDDVKLLTEVSTIIFRFHFNLLAWLVVIQKMVLLECCLYSGCPKVKISITNFKFSPTDHFNLHF